MDILEKLFGSETKIKIMKLFLFNAESFYDISDIEDKTKSKRSKVLRETRILEKIGMIKKRVFYKTIQSEKGNSEVLKKKKTIGYILNSQFRYMVQLQNFLVNTNPLQNKEILRKVNSIGKINVLLVAGIFTQDEDSRVDMLVVGDGIKEEMLKRAVRNIESVVGRELRYAFFETIDYKYRLNMCDKLIRDILDCPHEVIIDKLRVSDSSVIHRN